MPAYEHISLQVLSIAGILPIIIVGLPGIHGAAVTGTQGTGIMPPSVAGFAGDLQMPKGRMFTKGLLSIIVATGIVVITFDVGSTIIGAGATPKLHINWAPVQTNNPICSLCLLSYCID